MKFLIFSNPSLFIFPILKQLTPILEKSLFKSDSDCIISPAFSEKNNLTVSLHPISVRSMSIPILLEEKHNSSKAVIIPPDDISWPDFILLALIKSWTRLNASLNFFESFIVGASVPILFCVCAKDDPPSFNSSKDISI